MTAQLDRHDPRRNDALGLVRRMVKAGNFKRGDVDRWKTELGDEVVDGIVQEYAPKKATSKKAAPKDAPAEPDKE